MKNSLCFVILFIITNISQGQDPVNSIVLETSLAYYPGTWAYSTLGLGGSYERKLSSSIAFGIAIENTAGYADIQIHDYSGKQIRIFYNEIESKNIWTLDFYCSYLIVANKKKNLLLKASGGLTFSDRRVDTLVSIWFGYPFNEGYYNGYTGSGLGLNLGEQLSYYPIKNLGLSVFTKFHAYTKYEADISLGIGLNIRFGDPRFKKKKSSE